MCNLHICRICLNTAVRGYKLDKYSLRSYYEYVTRQKITTNDKLPQWVCYECATMLHKFHKFKEKCLRGQNVLKQMSFKRESISIDAVSILNRFSENLASSLGYTISSKRVKTTTIKHKHKTKHKVIELEKVLLNFENDDSMKHEDIVVNDVKEDYNGSVTIDDDDKKLVEQIEIKSEINTIIEPPKDETTNPDEVADVPSTVDVKNNDITITNVDTGQKNTDLANSIDDHDDMGNADHIDNAESSDDENIFLDIVKKAVTGESKLVFLDNIQTEPVKKKRKYTAKTEKSSKVHKFEKPKKEHLTPEHWRKFNLSEEEAMREFKQRETSDQYVNANYKCHNCLKGFSKVDMLMRHVKFRHEESCGPIECRFCHMRFKQKNKLCKHLKQHYAVFQCLRCDMRFRLESSAAFHEDYHNGVTRKCKFCDEEFKHSSTYYTHLRMSHRSAHVCVACGASFVSVAGLQQHRRIKHYDNSDEPRTEQESTANTFCSKCDIRFSTQAAYDEHLTHSNMHGDLNTESDIARSNLKGNKKLAPQSYKGLRKKKPTTCQYCGKHFATQGQCMKHHIAEHPRRSFYPPDKRHICEICGQSLAAVSIASHMNRHTREHVYPCATCGMQFISKSSHHRHQVTHTGERPYPCPLCEKRFTQKNSMQLHYRTFHLKQPYPKRNRRKKTDVEMPIMECAINRERVQMLECRDRSDLDSNDTPPAGRWRNSF